MHVPLIINIFPLNVHDGVSGGSSQPLTTRCSPAPANSLLSLFKLVGVDSSVIWGCLRAQSGIVYPLDASAPPLVFSITSQAFVSSVLVHRGRRSKLWARNKLPGGAPALRSALPLRPRHTRTHATAVSQTRQFREATHRNLVCEPKQLYLYWLCPYFKHLSTSDF